MPSKGKKKKNTLLSRGNSTRNVENADSSESTPQKGQTATEMQLTKRRKAADEIDLGNNLPKRQRKDFFHVVEQANVNLNQRKLAQLRVEGCTAKKVGSILS